MPNNKFNNLRDSLKFGEAFCVLPFIHFHVGVDKKQKICCLSESEVDSTSLNEIRNKMLNGEFPVECSVCYAKENQKLISGRQRAIKNHLSDEDKVIDSIQMHINGKPPKLLSYDLRYSNLCNLECQMCSATYSSSIAEAQGITNKFLSSELDIKINDSATDIYLAGGEPFLIKSFSRLLNNVTNKDCEIVINTNCTILTEHLMSALDKFSNVSFIVSIDGYGILNEKIRKNSQWNDIVKNLEILAKRFGGYHKFFINTVVQKDNVNNLLELGTWLVSIGINKWRLNPLAEPKELLYANCDNIYIPDELMELPLVSNNIENMLVLKSIKNYAKNS